MHSPHSAHFSACSRSSVDSTPFQAHSRRSVSPQSLWNSFPADNPQNTIDHGCFLRGNPEAILTQSEPGRCAAGIKRAALHSLLDAPPHISGYGLALRLCAGSNHRRQHLAGHHLGINVMFLEEDADPKGFEFPDSIQALGGISRESGYGLHQHLIDSSVPAICKQSLEILSLFAEVPVTPSSA